MFVNRPVFVFGILNLLFGTAYMINSKVTNLFFSLVPHNYPNKRFNSNLLVNTLASVGKFVSLNYITVIFYFMEGDKINPFNTYFFGPLTFYFIVNTCIFIYYRKSYDLTIQNIVLINYYNL